MRQLSMAHRALAELKGISHTIPNEQILINTLTLQEAKDKSSVENIVTTQDELFAAKPDFEYSNISSVATKEVLRYRESAEVWF